MNNAQVCSGSEISTLLSCHQCRKSFEPSNKRQRFCSANCRAAAHYGPIKQFNTERRNVKYKARNRDKVIGFDGRYGGPETASRGNKVLPRLGCGCVSVGVVADKFASAGV